MEQLIRISQLEYQNGPGIGSHQLMDVLKSPKTYYYKHILKREQPVETDALRFGRIVHSAVLEPEDFKQRYRVRPKFDRRTKQGKEDSLAWDATCSPRDFIIEPEESETLLGMIESVKSHPRARSLLSNGLAEMSGYFTVDDTVCRIRPDFLVEDKDRVYIVDLKTTRDASLGAFSRNVFSYKYFLQAALYHDGTQKITGKPTVFVFMAMEKTLPYEIGLYVADETVIECGRAAYKKALSILKTCEETQKWPGLSEEFVNLSMPSWALMEWGPHE